MTARRQERRNPRKALSLAILLLGHRLGALSVSLASGALSPQAYLRQSGTLLTRLHTKAARLGRYVAGDQEPLSLGDVQVAYRMVEEDLHFLLGFRKDLTTGRYTKPDGTTDEKAIRRRARMYGQKLLGTSNRAWAATLDAQSDHVILALWELNSRESCPTCIDEAGMGWRLLSDMDRYPGDGSSECGVNCRCLVITMDGDKSLANPF